MRPIRAPPLTGGSPRDRVRRPRRRVLRRVLRPRADRRDGRRQPRLRRPAGRTSRPAGRARSAARSSTAGRRRSRPSGTTCSTSTSGSIATCSSGSWRRTGSTRSSWREDAWSPMAWVYLIGEGFFGLIAREFAPLADRLGLARVAGRAPAGGPRRRAARRSSASPGRPVDRFHTETALEQWPGLIGVVDEAIAAGEAAAGRRPGGRRGPAAAARGARRSPPRRSTRSSATCATRSCRRPTGEGRLGPELFAAKMAHTMQDPAMTPDRIRERAEREFARGPGRDDPDRPRDRAGRGSATRPIPDDDGAVVRAVLDAVAVDHPTATELLDFCRAELGADRGVLPRDATSSGWPTSRSRSAGRRCSCARSAARC